MISRAERTLNYLVLIVFAAVVLIPLVLLLGASLSPNQSGGIDLGQLRFSNFLRAWQGADFAGHLLNSTLVSGTTVLLTLVLAPLAAYGLGILLAPGHKWVFTVFLAGIMIPLEGIIVPLYLAMKATPFASTLTALIIAQTGLSMSFGVFWMRASFRAIPPAILEAARIDGASDFQTLRKIVLPITVPAIITLGILTFMWVWNDYFLAFVLVNDPDQLPVTVALGQFATRYTQQVNLMSAGAILVALPILILYVIFQRKFIDGVLSGALKG